MALLSLAGVALILAGCSSKAASTPTTVDPGPSLASLTGHVTKTLEDKGGGGFNVTGVASVSCAAPSAWRPGATFTCHAYNASKSELGQLDGTILADSGGKRRWNSGWIPLTASGATSPSPGLSDVTLTGCNVDASLSSLADIAGTVVNHGAQAYDYDIVVTLMQGSVRVGQAEEFESAIQAGQTAAWSTTSIITAANGGDITCLLASVNPSASIP